ncbi:RIP metalloprotease RseP [Solimonas sp. K1W22B-7]|uniref:RIP metalloprotease RseP n=1 Tax=Solimonas sp. K1W22B-7 TaxID=2303331 RepID=UPI000E32FF04|nr:RIP metalloprotease RseP [Solimonas sp. K1W22B-7]AXQ28980.1 RIP metalloprotease RseP [Solimonas sp. K1W22B-7]
MHDFFWGLGGFIVAMGVLVAFHEFGHYWVARRCGVKVLRFSIGFGRQIWTRRAADGVEWTLSAIPLGGYVKMLDEREGPVPAAERHLAFNNATVGRRILIVAAGPTFNFLLAIAFYWLVLVMGVQSIKPMIAAPAEKSAAAAAGLREGEQILQVAGALTPTWIELRTELMDKAMAGGSMPLRVQAADGGMRDVHLDLRGVRVDPQFVFTDLGLEVYEPPIPAIAASVEKGSAADAAGMRDGDQIVSLNGQPMANRREVIAWVSARPEQVVRIGILRGSQTLELQAIVGRVETQGRVIGRLGVSLGVLPGSDIAGSRDLWQDLRAESRRDPLEAMPAAVAQTWRMSALTLKLLWRIVIGEVSLKNISGPIQIAEVAGYSAQIGLVQFLAFLAAMSVSLGVINLLPVPVLDGGHLLFYGIEALKGSPLSARAQEFGLRLGFTFVVMLMGLAFYNDLLPRFAKLLN